MAMIQEHTVIIYARKQPDFKNTLFMYMYVYHDNTVTVYLPKSLDSI